MGFSPIENIKFIKRRIHNIRIHTHTHTHTHTASNITEKRESDPQCQNCHLDGLFLWVDNMITGSPLVPLLFSLAGQEKARRSKKHGFRVNMVGIQGSDSQSCQSTMFLTRADLISGFPWTPKNGSLDYLFLVFPDFQI